MPGVGSVELLNMAPGRVVIHTVGLRELSKTLTRVAIDDLPKRFAKEMRAAGEPIAQKARGYAPDTSGDFAGSIRIAGGRSGISLVSKDEAAGVIDFARQGPRGEPLTAAWGPPSRSLFRAIDEELPRVAEDVEGAIARVVDAYLAADYRTPD